MRRLGFGRIVISMSATLAVAFLVALRPITAEATSLDVAVSLSIQNAGVDGETIPPAVAAAMEGVVGIRVREVARRPVWRNGRFETREVAGRGAGSGVVIDDSGLILTNAHVILGATEVQVRLFPGRTATARVIAVDDASDLALLRADGISCRKVTLAEGGVPPARTPVFLAGNRADLGPAIAWGRIGERRRVRVGARPIEFWAEVEAPLGPGDSGGAVLDTEGALLGVPGLQVLEGDGVAPPDGLPASGLFIPAEHVRRSIKRMLQSPRAAWPWFGVLLEDPLVSQAGGRMYDPEGGAVVRSVFPGSPADAAGVHRGDRIVAVDGHPVHNGFEALAAALDTSIGSEVGLQVVRAGTPLSLTAVTTQRPDDPRPDPLDDFALHTGLRLSLALPARDGPGMLSFASMSNTTRSRMPDPEAALFRDSPTLQAMLPGSDLLGGATRRIPVHSPADLAALMGRCFVDDQFVALLHWQMGGRRTLDRAHVHRKIHPVTF